MGIWSFSGRRLWMEFGLSNLQIDGRPVANLVTRVPISRMVASRPSISYRDQGATRRLRRAEFVTVNIQPG